MCISAYPNPELSPDVNHVSDPGARGFVSLACLCLFLRVNGLQNSVKAILDRPQVDLERKPLGEIGGSLQTLENSRFGRIGKKLLGNPFEVVTEGILQRGRVQGYAFEPGRVQKVVNALAIDLFLLEGAAELAVKNKFGRSLERPGQRDAEIGQKPHHRRVVLVESSVT